MKLMLFIMTLLAVILSACSRSPEESAAVIKKTQRELEYEAQTKYMKATRKAVFKEEALFQDNCKVGEMQWLDENGRRQYVTAVVCDGLPTNSVRYSVQSGKFSREVSLLTIGEPVDKVTAAKKILEDEKKRAEAEAKAKALEKLSPEDRKALGL